MRKWQSLLLVTILLALLAFVAWKWGQPFLDWLGVKGDLVQSLASFVALVSSFFSMISGVFSYLSLRGQKSAALPLVPEQQINTGGGAYVGGGVHTAGDFVGRDQKVTAKDGGLAAGGDIHIDIKEVVIGEVARQVWAGTKPGLDEKTLKAATEEYLCYIYDRHIYLTMKGMGPTETVSLKLKLLDLYVPLKARREVPIGETWDRELRLAGRKTIIDSVHDINHPLRLGKPEPVIEILKENDGVIILGDPGAGKTTFLKYLALKLARGEGADLGLEARLPILLPLAAYANALQEKDVRLDDFIVGYFDETGCDFPLDPMLSEALTVGKALILLDGLDEIKDLALRNTVVERVTNFYASHRRKGSKFVLTSRVVGYRDVRAAAEGMVECTLVDFDDNEINEFIVRWTSMFEKQALGDTAVAHWDAEHELMELMEAMETNEGIRRLAVNPLLLTILVLMKRKGVTLPEGRVQLYDQYITTLLITWNRTRSLSGRAPSRELDEVQITHVLAPLALWMHQVNPGVGLVNRADLYRKLNEIFRDRGDSDPDSAARQFIDDMHEHTALLLERGHNEYGFIHLTFEEYLAAVALAYLARDKADRVIDILAPHIGEQDWREVSLLAVSYIGIRQNLPRVAGLVVEGLASSYYGAPAEAAVLAGDATYDACPDGVTRESKEKVVDILVLAVQNCEAKPDLRRRAGLALGKLVDCKSCFDE